MYAILLPDEAADGFARKLGRGFVYVGRTDLRVEDRFERNWDEDWVGYNSKSARRLRDCGRENLRLMHEIHLPLNPVSRRPKGKGAIASYAEYHLAKLLEEAGYLVESDARTAFRTEPKESGEPSMMARKQNSSSEIVDGNLVVIIDDINAELGPNRRGIMRVAFGNISYLDISGTLNAYRSAKRGGDSTNLEWNLVGSRLEIRVIDMGYQERTGAKAHPRVAHGVKTFDGDLTVQLTLWRMKR